jgi:hypothetical protein
VTLGGQDLDPKHPCLLLSLCSSDMKKRDLQRTWHCLRQIDRSCQDAALAAVGNECVLVKAAVIGMSYRRIFI